MSPPELQYENADGQPGTVVTSRSSNRNLNAALNMSHIYNSSGTDQGNQWTTSGGIQFEDRKLNATQVLGRTLLSGQENVQQTTSQSVSSRIEPVRDLGVFAQEEVLLSNRRLLLTGGVRADRSSANGDTEKFFLYPKAAASYRFVEPFGGVEELKLRGAYGQTGNRALFGAKFVTDTTGTIGGQLGLTSGTARGIPPSSPSGRTSSRAGSMPHFSRGRAELSMTVYQRNIRDLILEQTVAPSVGQELRIFWQRRQDAEPGGRGVAHPAAGTEPRHQLDLSAPPSLPNKAKITELNVPPFQTGGFAFRWELSRSSRTARRLDLWHHRAPMWLGMRIAGKVGDCQSGLPDVLFE